jgi:hypothetical protein
MFIIKNLKSGEFFTTLNKRKNNEFDFDINNAYQFKNIRGAKKEIENIGYGIYEIIKIYTGY